MANNATLGGHVVIGDYAVLGGLSAVHQFVRIGQHAMIGGVTGVERDVIPFGSVMGDRARLSGINLIGMQRRGFSRDDIQSLRTPSRCCSPTPARSASGSPRSPSNSATSRRSATSSTSSAPQFARAHASPREMAGRARDPRRRRRAAGPRHRGVPRCRPAVLRPRLRGRGRSGNLCRRAACGGPDGRPARASASSMTPASRISSSPAASGGPPCSRCGRTGAPRSSSLASATVRSAITAC